MSKLIRRWTCQIGATVADRPPDSDLSPYGSGTSWGAKRRGSLWGARDVPVVLRRTIWIALLILPAAVAFAFAVAWSLSEPLAEDAPDAPSSAEASQRPGG